MSHPTTLRPAMTLRSCLVAAAILAAGMGAAVLAGPLDPPAGPVTPTFKTLQQVEPRIPVGPDTTPGSSTASFRITEPGSYYLTGNLTGQGTKIGIEIVAANVTLDLNGFTLTGGAATPTGIRIASSAAGFTIHNGFIRGWQSFGIDAQVAAGGTFENLTFEENLQLGLYAGTKSTIRHCMARANGTYGIYCYSSCILSDCVSTKNGQDGYIVSNGTILKNCIGNENGGNGLACSDGVSASDCMFNYNTGNGINGAWRCTFSDNQVLANTLCGIIAGTQSRVTGNNCETNGSGGAGYGIWVLANNHSLTITDNSCTGNDVGIKIDGPNSLVVRNFVRANSTSNLAIAAGNVVGPTVNGANIAASSNPHANYSN